MTRTEMLQRAAIEERKACEILGIPFNLTGVPDDAVLALNNAAALRNRAVIPEEGN